MATKKQRRRREKLQRHEYEYVVENEEGEEVPVESPRAVRGAPTGEHQPKLVDRRGRGHQLPAARDELVDGVALAQDDPRPPAVLDDGAERRVG